MQDIEKHNLIANANLSKLQDNPYPGRFILQGLDPNGNLVQIYAIMGRSSNSRNRIFVVDEKTGEVKTEAADVSKMEDPSLVIYTAMLQNENGYAVSNGHQTADVLKYGALNYGLANPLFTKAWQYEPDAPNYTPRISAICLPFQTGPEFSFSILKKSIFENAEACNHILYTYKHISAGFAYAISTYTGDGNPLPPFTGEPYLLPVYDDIQALADIYWDALNEENKVALVVKRVDLNSRFHEIVLRNNYEQVAQ